MNRFEQTSIWQKTLGKQLEPDIFEKERDFLRVEFERFRENAKLLASEIARVLPEFTVHDITHIDALWETAELVTKEDFNLTPPEAFVLGGTFLLHDLGMGLASFPKGIDELKKESIWKDTASSLFRDKYKRIARDADYLSLDPDIAKKATENVLRLLHAKNAERLALVSWEDKLNNEYFLLENAELRNSYGSIIGLIAHSHWWAVEELETKLPQMLGAPGVFPANWTIDPIKLACILRVADATQIDDRRAPSFLRAIRKPSNYADIHWNFQSKLYQPRLERSRLVYTSKSAFTIDEVESWWVCNDTLHMIDNELKEVDSLLVDTNRQRLKAIGVASIENPSRLSKLITVDGWHPVDTKIKVTNVAKLVGSLGGKQLYGDNTIVPLRELIQNASDAIRARRILEVESSDFGDISILLGTDSDGQYLEIQDNGIGMSTKVLTGPFLDFGESFWGTDMMHEELPGLESKGFCSTGKYGIGFFSVFMWGEKVTVTTKRYEEGRDSTLVIEFNKGATSRPILRKAKSEELLRDGGTKIKIWFSNRDIIDKLLQKEGRRKNKPKFKEVIEKLCPSLDCNLTLIEKDKKEKIIEANDWVSMPPMKLISRIMGDSYLKMLSKREYKILNDISNNMQLIQEDDGTIVGRLLLFREERKKDDGFTVEGTVSVGGMKTSGLSNLLGVLIGESVRASRDIGLPIISDKKLKEWATQQAELLFENKFNSEIQMACATIVRGCGGDTAKLKIVHHKKGVLNYEELLNTIKETNSNQYLVIFEATVRRYEEEQRAKIDYKENVFWTVSSIPGILQTRNVDYYIDWPKHDRNWFHSRTLEGLTTEAFSQIWNRSIDDILNCSDISSDDESFEASIGEINNKDAIIDFLDIIRKPK